MVTKKMLSILDVTFKCNFLGSCLFFNAVLISVFSLVSRQTEALINKSPEIRRPRQYNEPIIPIMTRSRCNTSGKGLHQRRSWRSYFTSDCLRKWREICFVMKETQRIHISFDSQLKTALCCCLSIGDVIGSEIMPQYLFLLGC